MTISNKELSFPFKRDPRRSLINKSPTGEAKGLDTLYQIKGSDLIIRQRDLEDKNVPLHDLMPKEYFSASEDKQRLILIDLAQKLKKIFLRLPHYGIETAFHNIVVGKDNDHQNRLFILTDLIHEAHDVYTDEDLSAIPESLKEKFKSDLKRTIAGLVDHFIDSVSSGEVFMDDLAGLQQFVFGKKDGDLEPNLYLTDVDARFLNNVSGGGLHYNCLYISGLVTTIKKAESLGIDCGADKAKLINYYKAHPEKFKNVGNYEIRQIESL